MFKCVCKISTYVVFLFLSIFNLSRQLNIETISLGFSGNSRLETEPGKAMTEIDASCYVIDCGPNLTPELAQQRTISYKISKRK